MDILLRICTLHKHDTTNGTPIYNITQQAVFFFVFFVLRLDYPKVSQIIILALKKGLQLAYGRGVRRADFWVGNSLLSHDHRHIPTAGVENSQCRNDRGVFGQRTEGPKTSFFFTRYSQKPC